MATATAIGAEEMANGVEMAVESWLAEIDQAFQDTRLTTLGRMNAVMDVLEKYKRLTGKQQLVRRKSCASGYGGGQ